MAGIRQVDFLPSRFDGKAKSHELATAHFLSFTDYLVAHELDEPADAAEIANIVTLFKRTLKEEARLWIEGKTFMTIDALKNSFIARFSPAHSEFANVKLFNAINYVTGDSAEQHLSKVRLAAQRIGYGEIQIKNQFLASLPSKCQAAVIMGAPDDADVDALAERAQRFLDLAATDIKEVVFSATPVNDEIEALRAELKDLKFQNALQANHENYPRENRPRSSASKSPARGRRNERHEYRSRDQSGSRSKSNDRRHQRRMIFCDYCKGPNHVWRRCFKRQRDLEAQSGMHNQQNQHYGHTMQGNYNHDSPNFH